jgi:formamidopyrimidine-DNA glycosylase
MPELPEVETIARGVDKYLRGDRIVAVWFCSHRNCFKTLAACQAKGLEGRSILAVHRTGKHIVCELGAACDHSLAQQSVKPEAQWIVHLGMTGRLLVSAPDVLVAHHTHARLSLKSGRELRFVDPRRFGRLDFRDLSCSPGFSAAGIDPLVVTAEKFTVLFHSRKMSIKAALLNQKLLTGVGNIYADESLFYAGIRPGKSCVRLTRAELERLRLAMRKVLKNAIRLGGSSVSDYVNANGEPGLFQLEHCVYQRTGLPCRRCQTPIRRIVLAGRGTHYCPSCQK